VWTIEMAALPSTAAHGRTMRAPLAAESCSRCGVVWPPVARIFPRGSRVQSPTPGNAFWSSSVECQAPGLEISNYHVRVYIVQQCFGSGSVLDWFQGQKYERKKMKKIRNVMFWRARCSHWRAGGFSWSLEDPHGGLSGFDDYHMYLNISYK